MTTMKTYSIQNSAGNHFGYYRAADEIEAVDAMARDRGWGDYAHACDDNIWPPDYEPVVGACGFERSRSFGDIIISERAS